MFPLYDTIPSRSLPIVNTAIIVICAFVFFAQLRTGDGGQVMIERYGMVPARVLHPDRPLMTQDPEYHQTRTGEIVVQMKERPLLPAAVPNWLTLLTCCFLHGGWMHILGNMWFLYIFGDNVEDRFGHLGYLLLYLIFGVAASSAQLAIGPGSTIPTIGASGAIAGVMGAYFYLYPHAKVVALVPLFIVFFQAVLPAQVFLALWFGIQFLNGAASMSDVQAGGVAWWAHIGGFVAGMALTWKLESAHWLRSRQTPRTVDSRVIYPVYRRKPD